jgi:thiamine kinase-like enzyme
VDDIDDILTHLRPSLGALAGAPAELDGGITNRNLLVTLGEREYVLRRPGKDTSLLGIDRESELIAGEAAAALGIAPAVAATFGDALVTHFVASRPLDAAGVTAHVEPIARALRRFHDSATTLPSRFSVPNLLAEYLKIVRGRGGSAGGEFGEAQAIAARIAAALPILDPRPCHNDLLAANFIRADASPPEGDDGRLLIVDWEYAGMGDARFDLGNLSVNNDFDDADDERLLHAYHGRAPSAGERAGVKLMRVLSDAREGAWGVVQAHVSALDFDFDGYAREHFERMRAAAAGAQFEQWLALARGETTGERRGQAA